ncbi:hypothetical protein [Pseudomonas fulva]|nr:hypothetical protein [Pseudomonas fulva]MBF8781909.1 hypothetical protein [Pseudomonas fulva]
MEIEQQPAPGRYPIEEDLDRQRRVWRFERIGWYVLLLIVLVSLAGLFGNGPLSQRSVTSSDGRIQVEYARFVRNGASQQLSIRVQGKPDAEVKLLLDGSMFRALPVETLQPQPLQSVSQGRALLLHLGTDAEGIATLYLGLRNDGVGPFDGKARVGPDSVVNFSTFIYP